MKKIFLLFLFVNLFANNYFTVKDYKFLNQTSPSLQDLIYEYHTYIKKHPKIRIFDLEAMNDGTEHNSDYKNFFQTKEGYKGVTLLFDTLKAGNQKFAVIGRQLGGSNSNINIMTHDYVFMKRSIYKIFDIMWGLNLHDEPKYETINGIEYFTKDEKNTIKFMFDIMVDNFNLSVETDKEKLEKTLFGYSFYTRYGLFNPKLIKGYSDIKYYDFYFYYDTQKLFYDYDLYIKTMAKYRKLDSSYNYNDGIISKVIEFKKYISIFTFSYGYSSSKEFTENTLNGYRFIIGISIPKSMSNHRKIQGEYYFGVSKNYYNDLANLRAINQELALFGVKAYW